MMRCWCLLLALLLAACSQERPERPSLTVLFTTCVLGHAEPCGCLKGDYGGLGRLAGAIGEVRAEGQPVLYFDAGDLLFDGANVDGLAARQLEDKARLFVDWLDEMDCAGWGLGDYDFAGGVPLLRELDARTDVPVLLSNVSDATTGEPLFLDRVVHQVGDWKIGVFSLLGRQLDDPVNADGEKVHAVGRQLVNRGLRLEDPISAARRIVPELAKECDLVILLAHLGYEATTRVTEKVEGIDLVLASHFKSKELASDRVGYTHIAFGMLKGTRLERADFYGDPLDRRRLDDSHRAAVRSTMRIDERMVSYLEKRQQGGLADEGDLTELIELRHRVELAHKALDGAPVVEGRNLYEHYPVTLDRLTPASSDSLASLRSYHTRVRDLWIAEGPGPQLPLSDNPLQNFVGYRACITCHPAQYEFWREETHHGNAYASLQVRQQEYDVECFRCHTVGWNQPGGFKLPLGAEAYDRIDVQCESCHGPGGFHAMGGEQVVWPGGILRAPPEELCTSCHNSDHDARFVYATKLEKIACPQTPQDDPIRLAALHSAEASLVARLDAGETRVRGALANTLLMLERPQEARAALEPALEEGPMSPALKMMLARTRLAAGDAVASRDLAEVLLQELGEDVEIRNLLAATFEEQGEWDKALAEALAALALAPNHPRVLARAASICLRGRGPEAVESLLTRHVERNPGAEAAADQVRALLASTEEESD